MSEFALKTALPAYLREEQRRIERLAAGAGLDFFPTVFEILTYDQMNEIADRDAIYPSIKTFLGKGR